MYTGKGHVNAWRVPVQWLPSVNMTTPSDDKLVPSRPLPQPFGFTRIFPANSFIRVIIYTVLRTSLGCFSIKAAVPRIKFNKSNREFYIMIYLVRW